MQITEVTLNTRIPHFIICHGERIYLLGAKYFITKSAWNRSEYNMYVPVCINHPVTILIRHVRLSIPSL